MAHRESPVQLTLLAPQTAQRPRWSLEGMACPGCTDGRLHMMEASDPCACAEAICICLAEGFATCDTCGELRQVWPREMALDWDADDAATGRR